MTIPATKICSHSGVLSGRMIGTTRLPPRLPVRDDLRSRFDAFVTENEPAHLDHDEHFALAFAA